VPNFQIRVVNSNYECCNDADAPNLAAARTEALRAALQIGAEEVCQGAPFFGAEIEVKLDGKLKERFLVSIGQSPLRGSTFFP
jgi:hypothetical protein